MYNISSHADIRSGAQGDDRRAEYISIPVSAIMRQLVIKTTDFIQNFQDMNGTCPLFSFFLYL